MASPLEALIEGFSQGRDQQMKQAKDAADTAAQQWERQYRLDQAQQEAQYHAGQLAYQNKAIDNRASTAADALAEKQRFHDSIKDFHQKAADTRLAVAKLGASATEKRAIINNLGSAYRGELLQAASPVDAAKIAQYQKQMFPEFDFSAIDRELNVNPSLAGTSQVGAAPQQPGSLQDLLGSTGTGSGVGTGAIPAPPMSPTVSPGQPAAGAPPVSTGNLIDLYDPGSAAAQAGQSAQQATAGETPLTPKTNVLALLSALQQQRANQPQQPAPGQAPVVPGAPVDPALTQPAPGAQARAEWFQDRGKAQLATADKTRTQDQILQDLRKGNQLHQQIMNNMAAEKLKQVQNDVKYMDATSQARIANLKADAAVKLDAIQNRHLQMAQDLVAFDYRQTQDALKNDATRAGALTKLRADMSHTMTQKDTLSKDKLTLTTEQAKMSQLLAPGYLEGLVNKDTGQKYTPAEAAQIRAGIEPKAAEASRRMQELVSMQSNVDREYSNMEKALQQSGGVTLYGGGAIKPVDPVRASTTLEEALQRQQQLRSADVYQNNKTVHKPGTQRSTPGPKTSRDPLGIR